MFFAPVSLQLKILQFSDRPCLNWQLTWYLTSSTHFWPLKFQLKWRQKCKIRQKCQFSHRTINHRKLCNAPLDALICPLQIINWQWTLIIDPHGENTCFIHHPSNVKNYSIGQKSETSQPKKGHPSYIFLHLSANFWVKIQNTHHYRNLEIFWTSGKPALSSPAYNPVVIYSKIQSKLRGVP